MNLYECPRTNDAAGYVLSALPDGEAQSFAYHVAECDDCAAKVAELGFVSHALLSAVPQLSAPPEIRSRIMSTVRAESELLLASGAAADRPSAGPQRRWGFGLGLGRLRPLTAGALAAVLLGAGIGAGALLQHGPGASCTTRAATSTVPGSTAKLEVCDGNARLALAGMQSPPSGHIYELWLDDPSDRVGPRPAGLFSVRGGKASVDVGKLHGHPKVLVTQEPLPDGSEVPTMQPVVTATA